MLPVLVLILWGIFEFGQGYNAKIELTGAVREGARSAALASGDPVQATKDAAPGLKASSLNVQVVTACPTNYAATDKATVKVTYPYAFNILFFGKGTWNISATGVMRCGG